MKNQNFLKHFFVIGSGTAINMLVGLVTTPVITRMVDPVEYGQLSIFTLYATIAVMVLCLGLDQALVRFYYESDTLEYRRALLFKELCRNNSYNSLAEIRVQTVFFSRK